MAKKIIKYTNRIVSLLITAVMALSMVMVTPMTTMAAGETITITYQSASIVTPGDTVNFTAEAHDSGGINGSFTSAIIWSIIGNNSSNTIITSPGGSSTLTIGSDETATSITITAKCTEGGLNISTTATVGIIQPVPPSSAGGSVSATFIAPRIDYPQKNDVFAVGDIIPVVVYSGSSGNTLSAKWTGSPTITADENSFASFTESLQAVGNNSITNAMQSGITYSTGVADLSDSKTISNFRLESIDSQSELTRDEFAEMLNKVQNGVVNTENDTPPPLMMNFNDMPKHRWSYDYSSYFAEDNSTLANANLLLELLEPLALDEMSLPNPNWKYRSSSPQSELEIGLYQSSVSIPLTPIENVNGLLLKYEPKNEFLQSINEMLEYFGYENLDEAAKALNLNPDSSPLMILSRLAAAYADALKEDEMKRQAQPIPIGEYFGEGVTTHEFDTADLPAGRYTITLLAGGSNIVETEIELTNAVFLGAPYNIVPYKDFTAGVISPYRHNQLKYKPIGAEDISENWVSASEVFGATKSGNKYNVESISLKGLSAGKYLLRLYSGNAEGMPLQVRQVMFGTGGFNMGTDNYSIENSDLGLNYAYGAAIPEELWTAVLGEDWVSRNREYVDSVTLQGHCFGFATSSILYYGQGGIWQDNPLYNMIAEGELKITTNVPVPTKPNSDILTLLSAFQISQMSDYVLDQRELTQYGLYNGKTIGTDKKSFDKLIELVEGSISEGGVPPALDVYGLLPLDEYWWSWGLSGHSIVPYKVEKSDHSSALPGIDYDRKIYYYDSNYPDATNLAISYSTKTNNWEMQLFKDIPIFWGSNSYAMAGTSKINLKSYNWMSYVDYKTIMNTMGGVTLPGSSKPVLHVSNYETVHINNQGFTNLIFTNEAATPSSRNFDGLNLPVLYDVPVHKSLSANYNMNYLVEPGDWFFRIEPESTIDRPSLSIDSPSLFFRAGAQDSAEAENKTSPVNGAELKMAPIGISEERLAKIQELLKKTDSSYTADDEYKEEDLYGLGQGLYGFKADNGSNIASFKDKDDGFYVYGSKKAQDWRNEDKGTADAKASFILSTDTNPRKNQAKPLSSFRLEEDGVYTVAVSGANISGKDGLTVNMVTDSASLNIKTVDSEAISVINSISGTAIIVSDAGKDFSLSFLSIGSGNDTTFTANGRLNGYVAFEPTDTGAVLYGDSGTVTVETNVNGVKNSINVPLTNSGTAIVISGEGEVSASENNGNPANFTDITMNDWFYEAVNKAAALGLVSGFPDGSFRPHEPMTAAQFISVSARTSRLELYETGGAWYESAVAALEDAGVIKNTDSFYGNWNEPIKREEMAYILVNLIEFTKPGTIPTNYEQARNIIPDIEKASPQYADYVLKAYAAELLHGRDSVGTFDPQGTLTRAEAVVAALQLQ